jgi:uncharacterized protein (TIGR00369 family)
MNLIEGLNIEYIHVYDREFEAKMNLTQFHAQPFGYLHGGATIAFGEATAGYASIQKIDKSKVAVGQSITANHMKAKKIEGYVLAKGKLMHMGKTSHVWSIEMLDENSELIAFVTVTNAIIELQGSN